MSTHAKCGAFSRGPVFGCDRLLLLLVLLPTVFLVSACAGRQARPNVPQQICNASADAAVASGNWEKALADHERLLIKEPANCLAMYHLGFIWGQLGGRDQEVEYYESAVECGFVSDDSLYFNLGMTYADTGEFDKALHSFERAAAINPENPDVHFGLGMLHQREGRPEMAEEAYLQALSIDAMHRQAHLMLTRLYLDQSRWDEAEEHLKTMRRIDPDDEEAEELRALMHSRRALEY